MTLSMMKDLKELHGQIIEQQVRKIILLKYLLQFWVFHGWFLQLINNSNWTEWSTLQGVIGRVISYCIAEREFSRLFPELYDTKSNY